MSSPFHKNPGGPHGLLEVLEVILFDAQDAFGADGCKLSRIAGYAQKGIALLTGETHEQLWERRAPIRKAAREFKERLAQGIEAQRAETTEIGSVADESPVPQGCAQTQSSTPDNKDKPNA